MGQGQIKALFLDIGGVLLTNGWDGQMRRRACEAFRLDCDETEERHHLTFDTYEEGKLSLDEYLRRVVFYHQRDFTPAEFRQFMFAQSQPYAEMIEFVRNIITQNNLRAGTISNEGRELAVHRISTFGLAEYIQFFVVSAFVHFRKPDEDIFRIALDIAQVPPEQAAYVEDRPMFVDIANSLGMQGIHHVHVEQTRKALAALGLRC